MLTYFVQVNICWLLFYSLYFALLSRETFFILNRIYLIISFLLGLLLPIGVGRLAIEQVEIPPTIWLNPLVVNANHIRQNLHQWTNWETWTLAYWLKIGYWCGVIWHFLRLIVGFYRIFSIYQKANFCEKIYSENQYFTLVSMNTPNMPFSFFRYIFVYPTMFQEYDFEQVIQHEKAHAKQGHSFDVLFFELIGILFWASPLAYAYRISLKNVHEYLADAAVLRSVATPQYGRFLLRQNTQYNENVLFTNNFFSQLKKRILMMSRNPSQRRALLKYGFALPLFVYLFVFFAVPNNVLLAKAEWLTQKMEHIDMFADTLKPLSPLTKKLNPTASQLRNNKKSRGFEAAPTPKIETRAVAAATIESDSTPQKMAAVTPPQVDVMPHYLPNTDSLFRFLARNIRYPDAARQVRAEGTVLVGFIIEKDGSVAEVAVKKGVKYTDKMLIAQGSLEKEAIRVVSLMPKWMAGTLKGEPVRANFVLPIKFKLD